MFYYYAHTNHKENLDRLRRGVAFAKELKSKNINVKLLVNDFRAGIVSRELGWDNVLNIETISDIDLVLEISDKLLIDSNEELPLQFESFCRDYTLFRVAQTCDDIAIYNEIVVYPWISEQNQAIFIDKQYKEVATKADRVLFFFGDSDSKKIILENSEFFKTNKMELLLGHYFYVQYESDIEHLFTKMYEAEEYTEMIKTSSVVITCSLQCALEASSCGARTIFLSTSELLQCHKDLLVAYGIKIINGFNQNFNTNILDEHINFTQKVNNETNFNLFLS